MIVRGFFSDMFIKAARASIYTRTKADVAKAYPLMDIHAG